MDSTAKIVGWAGGAIFVGAYIVLLILQFSHIGAADDEWVRRLELLSPLQSLAFAGAGVLLGTAVQQQATKKAQEQADQNQEVANKAHELAGAVKATAAAPGATPKEIEALVPVAEEIGTG
jgi:uncharacterized protein YfiM (DUF2279 family)